MRNEIDVTVFYMKRVVVKYTLVDPDIDVILQQYNPVSASVILDAIWGDCEFIPVGKLSRIDRYLLKKRLKHRNLDSNKIIIGPKIVERTTKDGKLEQNFMVTTCDLSDASQSILNQLSENHIPLNKVDVMQRTILQAANVSTKWGCLMCRDAAYVTLIIGMDNQLVMVRNLLEDESEQYAREITQTFQYLSRTAYLEEDEITILQEEGIAPLSNLSVNCKSVERFVVRQSSPKYLYHKRTRALHTAYLIPKISTCIAIALGAFLMPTSIRNLRTAQAEEERQKIFEKTNHLASEKELALLESRSSGQKILEKLCKYKFSLRWSEQNFLEALTFALETVHKGRFLQKLHCSTEENSVLLNINFSPADLYRNDIHAAEADTLKQHEGEILATGKRELLSKFNKPINFKTKIIDKNICLHVVINETNTHISENKAPWYYKFDSKVSNAIPKA
jgi:hypothetical protein